MHTTRSACRAGSLSRSAEETASTDSMSRARQVLMMRAAISPRLAIRILRMAMTLSVLARPHQHFAEFHQRLVSRQDFRDDTLDASPHRIHELHDFDDGNDAVRLHPR